MNRACGCGETRVSPSQVKTWMTCERKWGFDKLAGLPMLETTALQLGKEVHGHIEKYYESGLIPTATDRTKAATLFESGVNWLPPLQIHGGSPYKIEAHITAGDYWHGYMDLWDKPSAIVWDWKTTKNFRYMKTPKELMTEDIQAVVYARAALEGALHATTATLYWHYFRSDGVPGHRIAEALVSRDANEQALEGFILPTERLLAAKRDGEKNTDWVNSNLAPNRNQCYSYNKPCDFIAVCKTQSSIELFEVLTKGNKTMGMLDDLMKKAKKPVEPTEDLKEVAEKVMADVKLSDEPVHSGYGRQINPPKLEAIGPVGPPPMSVETVVPVAPPTIPTPPPVMLEEAKLPAPPKMPSFEETKPSQHVTFVVDPKDLVLTTPTRETMLFIDCIPLKVEVNGFAKLIEAAKKTVETDLGISDYRFAEYGKGPGMLLQAFKYHFEKITEQEVVMVVNTSQPETSVVLAYLESVCDSIVRGIR